MKEKINSISGTALGVLFGVIAGIVLKNLGLWICLGLAIGAAIDYTKQKQSSHNKSDSHEN